MKIFNKSFFGPKQEKTSPTKSIGAPGTPIWGGYIASNEKNAKLVGTTRYKTYSEILANVSIAAAGVRYYLNLIAKSKWSLIPADESPEAQKYADIMTEQLDSMDTSWSRVVRRAAMYRFFGFSIQAWTAIKSEGVILFKDIAPRPQQTIERWDTDETGYVNGVGQRSPQNSEEIYIPRDRIIYMVDDSLSDSPEGLGLFRHIVESTDRLQRYEQLEGYGYESDLRGIPIGKAPIARLDALVESKDITPADKVNILAPLKKFINNHIKNPALGMILDSTHYISTGENQAISSAPQWNLELLKGSSTSLPEIAKAIERINREIARTLGIEGLLLGGETGTQALSVDKSLNLAIIIDSTLEELKDTFQNDIIERIRILNGWPVELMPKFKTEAIRHRDITQVTQALKDLADSGVMISPDDPLVSEILELLGLSPLDTKLKRGLDLVDEDEDKEEENEKAGDKIKETKEEK